MSEKLVLLDGNSYLYRAYHAIPKICNKDGMNTNAIRGILKMFASIYKNVDFDYIACVFDASKKNFRHSLYPQYKANRSPMPSDLLEQVEYVHKLVDLIGWNKVIVPDVEADDAIGTIAINASNKGMRVYIYTKDKDAAQLVNENIRIVDPSSLEVLDANKVHNRFGVYPDQIIDYLAILGDNCDNVPGIQKAGKKTASEWLSKYGSIENIIEHIDELNGSAGKNLRTSIDQLMLSRKLVTIKIDCDLTNIIEGWDSYESLKPKEVCRQEIRDMKDMCGIKY